MDHLITSSPDGRILSIGGQTVIFSDPVKRYFPARNGVLIETGADRRRPGPPRNLHFYTAQGQFRWAVQEPTLNDNTGGRYDLFREQDGILIGQTFEGVEYEISWRDGTVTPYSPDPRARVDNDGALIINGSRISTPGKVRKFSVHDGAIYVLFAPYGGQNIWKFDFDGNPTWKIQETKIPPPDNTICGYSGYEISEGALRVSCTIGADGVADLKTGAVKLNFNRRPW